MTECRIEKKHVRAVQDPIEKALMCIAYLRQSAFPKQQELVEIVNDGFMAMIEEQARLSSDIVLLQKIVPHMSGILAKHSKYLK